MNGIRPSEGRSFVAERTRPRTGYGESVYIAEEICARVSEESRGAEH